jgi:hypothetical protein
VPSLLASVLSAGYDDVSFAANYYLRRRCPRLLTAAESAVDLLRSPWVEPRLLCRWGGVADGALRALLAVQSPQHARVLTAAIDALGAQGSASPVPRRSMALHPCKVPDVDLELLEIPSWQANVFSRAGYFIVPKLVAMTIDLRQPLEGALCHKDVRRKVRGLAQLGYQYEVRRDEASFLELVHRMYLPTMRRRHGGQTYLRRERYLRHGLKHGWVLILSRDGQRVGGALNIRRHGQPVVEHWVGGALEGDPRGLHRDVDSALIYFTLLWARQLPGVTRLSLTSCYPFLRDGLLLFKKRWGARLGVEQIWSTCLALRINRWTGWVRRFLAASPLVVAARSGPVGLAAWEEPARLRQLPCPGLEGLWVLAAPGEADRGPLPDGAQIVSLTRGAEVEQLRQLAVDGAR